MTFALTCGPTRWTIPSLSSLLSRGTIHGRLLCPWQTLANSPLAARTAKQFEIYARTSGRREEKLWSYRNGSFCSTVTALRLGWQQGGATTAAKTDAVAAASTFLAAAAEEVTTTLKAQEGLRGRLLLLLPLRCQNGEQLTVTCQRRQGLLCSSCPSCCWRGLNLPVVPCPCGCLRATRVWLIMIS